jgi:hypothetical protein
MKPHINNILIGINTSYQSKIEFASLISEEQQSTINTIVRLLIPDNTVRQKLYCNVANGIKLAMYGQLDA